MLDLSERSLSEIKAAGIWLKSLPFGGQEAARRFSETLDRVLPELCQDIAERFASGSNLPRPDEEASIAFSQPSYKHVFTTGTGRRRRGQTSGIWVIIYALPGNDTLQILTVRHGASESLTEFLDEPAL